MPLRLRFNNLSGTVQDNPLAAGVTTMTVPASFPTVLAPYVMALSIEPDNPNEEVVYVTGHAAGATTATILRGQDGGTVGGTQHNFGVTWRHGPTASDFSSASDFSVKSPYYGAKGGAQIVSDGVMYAVGTPSGGSGFSPRSGPAARGPFAASARFGDSRADPTILHSQSATFTSADVGKVVVVAGAGANGLALITTIASVLGPNQVQTATAASTSVNGAYVAWGYDDSAAFQKADTDAAKAPALGGSPSEVYVPTDNYIIAAQVRKSSAWYWAGCGVVAAANLANGLFSVAAADVRDTGRAVFYGMTCLADVYNVNVQRDFDLNLHAKAVMLGLPLPNAPAPQCTAQAGSTPLPGGSYTVMATYVDPIGSEATGGVGTVTVLTSGQSLQCTAVNVPPSVTAVNFYVASGPAGVVTGLWATVVPSGGSSSATLSSPTAANGAPVPVTNRSGNNLVNSINGDGCRIDGWYTSVDSAMFRIDGTSHATVKGVKAGPYVRDPQQAIVNMGDLQGVNGPNGLKLNSCHVDGGGILRNSVLVAAQWGGGGPHPRNVQITDVSVDGTAGLADGLDVVQCDWVNVTGGEFSSCGANGLVIVGCNYVTVNGGGSRLCGSPGLQIGDPTVAFSTNLVTISGFQVVDCGFNANTGNTGILLYTQPGAGINLITFVGCESFQSVQTGMFYGIATIAVGGGSFFDIKVIGGYYNGTKGPANDAGSSTLTFLDVGGSWGATTPVSTTASVTSPVTAAANSAADQSLMQLSIPAQRLNANGRTLRITAQGVYSTQATIPSVTVKVKLGSLTLLTFSAGTPGTQPAGAGWSLEARISCVATGASGTLESHGKLEIVESSSSTAAASVFLDSNNAVSSAIDLTAAQTLLVTVAFGNASVSNSMTERLLTAEVAA